MEGTNGYHEETVKLLSKCKRLFGGQNDYTMVPQNIDGARHAILARLSDQTRLHEYSLDAC